MTKMFKQKLNKEIWKGCVWSKIVMVETHFDYQSQLYEKNIRNEP